MRSLQHKKMFLEPKKGGFLCQIVQNGAKMFSKIKKSEILKSPRQKSSPISFLFANFKKV